MPGLTPRGWEIFRRGVFLILALIAIIGTLRAATIIPAHVPLDPNEGWNAYHALAAMAGHGLYPPHGSLMINNYPPLSFYIVGVLGHGLGDMILAGRLVSLAAFCAVCMGIAGLARRKGCGPGPAFFAAFLFADVLLLYSDYVAMDDPQLLGHAFDLAGVFLLLREPRKISALIAGALLLTIAGFIKHNLIVAPLVMAIWLLRQERRAASIFILSGIVCAIAGLGLFHLVYGVSLTDQLASARVYGMDNLSAALKAWLPLGAAPLFIATWLWRRHGRDRYVLFCVLYALIGFVIGCIFSGGDGVDANAMFDADIGLVLCCALALQHFITPQIRAVIAALCVLSLVTGLWLAASADVLQPGYWLHPLADETAQAQSDIDFLRAHPGPAFCETPSLCYWAGKPGSVDVFNVGEQIATGARSDAPFVRAIANGDFAVIEFDSLRPFALSPDIEKSLLARYRIARNDDDGVFLIPR
jgi:hypothetical protein